MTRHAHIQFKWILRMCRIGYRTSDNPCNPVLARGSSPTRPSEKIVLPYSSELWATVLQRSNGFSLLLPRLPALPFPPLLPSLPFVPFLCTFRTCRTFRTFPTFPPVVPRFSVVVSSQRFSHRVHRRQICFGSFAQAFFNLFANPGMPSARFSSQRPAQRVYSTQASFGRVAQGRGGETVLHTSISLDRHMVP